MRNRVAILLPAATLSVVLTGAFVGCQSKISSAPMAVANANLRADPAPAPAVEPTDAPADAPATQPVAADKPLYELSPQETAAVIAEAQRTVPDLRQRIVHLARRNLGQPYDLYLLGEAPFETIDPQPIYCLDRSDCVTFAEHTLAMALSDDWDSFLTMLQRIRYVDGQIGVRTRNHYTEADWNPNNAWLFEDACTDLAGEAAGEYAQSVDRARFFKQRYEIESDVPVEKLTVDYVPLEAVAQVASQLRDGDLVNFVRGRADAEGNLSGLYVGHVGMIAIGEDGQPNVIHSARPKVREQPLAEIVESAMAKTPEEGKVALAGFKFLRLQEDPIANLRQIDGSETPRVTLPDGTPFDPDDVPLTNEPTTPMTAR